MLRSFYTNKFYYPCLQFSQARRLDGCFQFAVNLRSLSSVSDAVKAEVKAENEDISTMDRCMKRIREQFETKLSSPNLDFIDLCRRKG